MSRRRRSRHPVRPLRQILGMLAWGLGFAAVACGGAPAGPPADTEIGAAADRGPVPVPMPEVGGFAAEVQQQFRDEYSALQTAIAAGNATEDQYGRLGMRFAAYGLVDAAEAAYLNARRLAPEEFRWGYYLGLLYDETSRPGDAIETLEQALRLSPGYIAGLSKLGDLLASQDRPDEAGRRYADALALDARCNPCLVGLGQLALQARDFRRAVDYLEQALRLAPQAAAIRYPLALAYRGLGDEAAAQAQLQARTEATLNTGMGKQIDRPGAPDPLLGELRAMAAAGSVAIEARGVTAARQGRWTDAIADFNELVAADSENAVSRNLLATALLTIGEREEAKHHYEEAVRIDPGHARANLQLGILLAEDGLETGAIARFRQAIQSDPGSNIAYLNLARALMRSGEPGEAVKVYEQLLGLDPSNAPARLGRAFALIRDGRHAEAKTRLQEDMQVRPAELAFPHTLARLLAASPDAGVRDGVRAVGLMQTVSAELRTGPIIETAAMAMAEAGDFGQAQQLQQLVIELAGQAGRLDELAHLRAVMARYQAGQASRTPFRDDDPLFFPPPFIPPVASDDDVR